MIMDGTNEGRYVFNLGLIKLLGFHRVLNPDSVKFYGHNAIHIVIALFGSYLIALSTKLLYAECYLVRDEVGLFVCFGYAINFLFSVWKISNVMYNSKDIWKCSDVTSSVFTSYRHNDDDDVNLVHENWRRRTAKIINIFVVLGFSEVFLLALSPFAFDDVMFSTRQLDGSYRMYRLNILNLFQTLPSETYNDRFYVFYIVELVAFVCFAYFSIIFDIIVVVLCFAFSCQLEAISSALRSFGHVKNTRTPADKSSANVGVQSGEKSNSSDSLITIIADHEKVINCLYEFYSIFRSVLLAQIFVSASSFICIWLIAAMSIVGEDTGHNILTVKCIVMFPMFTLQLLLPCHLFSDLNEKKDSIVFALYCSNWIDMDLKDKKFILCAMKTINANQMKLKFTKSKIVDMELFTSTMRLSYSLFSMLINNIGKNPNKMK